MKANYETMNQSLKNYISKKSPDYSLLLKGSWGCGKTYFIKQFCSKNNCIYYSLNGIVSIPAVINSLFTLAIKFCKTGTGVSDSTGQIVNELQSMSSKAEGKANFFLNFGTSAINIFAELKGNELLRNTDKNIIFVLDDLERISESIDITDLLGSIHSRFIENGIKVIFVADETKIKDSGKFAEEREKYIQRTISFSNDKNNTFKSFLESRKIFSNDFLEILHEVFPEEQVNLRTVSFCLECYIDIKKFAEGLNSDDYNSTDSLFYTICCIGNFYKQGNTDKDKLWKALQTYFYNSYQRNSDKEKNKYELFSEEFGNRLIKREFIINLIYDGILDEEEFEFFLRKIKHIEDPLDKLYNIVELETIELKNILVQIKENLKEKKYSIRKNADLQQQFMPNAIKMSILSEEECIRLISDSVFAKENYAELKETFDYWIKNDFSHPKILQNDFDKELENHFIEYKNEHDKAEIESFFTGISKCSGDIFADTFRYTIFSSLKKQGYFEKIFSLPNKSIRFFAAYISSAITHVINANEFYMGELDALKALNALCAEHIKNVPSEDFLKLEALAYLKKTLDEAVCHIEHEPYQG